MGCNYNYDDSEKDLQILVKDNFLQVDNILKNKKKDAFIKSVFKDYQELKKKYQKLKIKYLKSKKSVKNENKVIGQNMKNKPKNLINKIKILHYNSNSKNKLPDKTVKIIANFRNKKSSQKMQYTKNELIKGKIIKVKKRNNSINEINKNNTDSLKLNRIKIKDKNYSLSDNIKLGNELIKNKKKVKYKDKDNPANLQYINDLTNDSYSYFYLDNIFTVFNSIDKILYLIYGTNNRSIISYNLIENIKVIEIKNAHKELITNFRYYPDKINKRDLVISLSYDNNIKLWNANNWECLSNFEEINKKGYLLSACFLIENNNYYIITSNYSDNSELLKVFDLNGNKIKELINSGDDSSFIDTYYDLKLNKNYIITGNIGYVKSYDYNEEKIYHEYSENDLEDHCSIIIYDKEDVVKIIESSGDGNIRIWNFHTGELINKLIIIKKRLFGICLWNDEYLFVGCEDKTIKLIELKTGEVINNLIGYNKVVLSIKKIYHPKYGDCLLSQGNYNNQIKLWAFKN